MTKVVLLGHSHLGAIVRAYEEQKTRQESDLHVHTIQCIRKDIPHIVHGSRGWEYHPDGVDELQRTIETVRPRVVFYALQGEQAVWAGVLPPERVFDFFFPGDAHIAGGSAGEVVPFDIIMEIARNHHRLAASFLDQVQSIVTVPSFGISPPPLVGDADFMIERLRSFEIYPKLKEQGPAPRLWRQKMWRAHILALAEVYRARDCGFLDVPKDALDDEGFLKASLYGDAFHANKGYGALVLAQMLQTAAQTTG